MFALEPKSVGLDDTELNAKQESITKTMIATAKESFNGDDQPSTLDCGAVQEKSPNIAGDDIASTTNAGSFPGVHIYLQWNIPSHAF